MKRIISAIAFTAMATILVPETSNAQQYKISQTSSTMGMKSTTTIYVKGMRKRTEGGAIMGMGGNIVTIEQCDLQRTIKLNDKKKLYIIEPFSKGNEEEIIDEDAAPVKNKPVTPKPKEVAPQKGGTITMYYSITDTGERKKMYGFTARHVWTMQKMKPSADACTMKDSIVIKTDGWYIDLPEFNCPVHYRQVARTSRPAETEKPDCRDRFIVRRKGKGKLGFALTETTTFIMGGSNPKMGEMTTGIETMEFSAAKLDSMLFVIPPGYQQAASEEDLQEKMSMKDILKNAKENAGDLRNMMPEQEKKPGNIRIGVYEPKGGDNIQPSTQQLEMLSALTGEKVDAVAISSDEEARSKKCDYILNSEIVKMKSGSKVGGLLKAIKNADPGGASSFTVQATLTLVSLGDGSVRTTQSVDGKYEGKAPEAVRHALNDGCKKVINELN